jgi:hypothetical protein
MTSRSRIRDHESRREDDATAPDTVAVDLRALGHPSAATSTSATNSLWRQIDRWVNEGGAITSWASGTTDR